MRRASSTAAVAEGETLCRKPKYVGSPLPNTDCEMLLSLGRNIVAPDISRMSIWLRAARPAEVERFCSKTPGSDGAVHSGALVLLPCWEGYYITGMRPMICIPRKKGADERHNHCSRTPRSNVSASHDPGVVVTGQQLRTRTAAGLPPPPSVSA